MKFLNLNRELGNLDRYNKRGGTMSKRDRRKRIIRIAVVLIVLVLVIYLPIRAIYSSSKALVASARSVSDAAKTENLDEIKKSIQATKKAAGNLNSSLNLVFWIRLLPYFGGFYTDAKHFAKASEYELEAVEDIVDMLSPYKNELGFTGGAAGGKDRIAQVVQILDKIAPQLDKIEPQLKRAREEVESINVDKYPEKLGRYQLKSQIGGVKNLIIGSHIAVSEARDALLIAPETLGEPTPKTYLLIFQNDKEIRATGGFMTAYAFMKFEKGRVSSSTSDDIYRLDEKLLETCKNVICPLTPPQPLVKYLPEVNGKPRTAWSMRDSNLSPDVPTSMRQFEKLYSFLKESEEFDGIILIDTHVLEELIKITGPIDVFGTTYSGETDKRCNCPNVIYELESYANIIERGEKDRKAILGTLMQQLLARSLGAPINKMPEFIDAGVKLASGKHIMLYMHDPEAQSAFSKLNWTGEVNPSAGSGQDKGDYLHVNDSNFAGGKSNLYVTYDAVLEINDSIHKLTLNYKNPQAYNTWLNGINRDYLRIYVPKGSRLISSKGSQEEVTTIEDELGKTVFEAFFQVRPQNSVSLEFEYEVPQNFSKSKEYPILIQKQPGSKNFSYEIKVNGKTKEKFELDSDKELKLLI